jgi:uncharacterized protein (DUF433 family)
MFTLPNTLTIPLRIDPDGIIRVGETRVTLQSIVADYHRGYNPAEIAEHFPSVESSEIYVVIAYYLQNRQEVDEYVRLQGQESAKIREEFGALFPTIDFRSRVKIKE